jgi:hypothetical protein
VAVKNALGEGFSMGVCLNRISCGYKGSCRGLVYTDSCRVHEAHAEVLLLARASQITQWACRLSTFVAFQGCLAGVLSALSGVFWDVTGGIWSVCLSASSMRGGYCMGEGRLDTSGCLAPVNDVLFCA